MDVVFRIPGPLRNLAGDRDEVRVAGAPRVLSEALSLLWAECPAVRDRVITERGEVRQHINVFVDGEMGREETALGGDACIDVLPAISGGAE